MRLKLSAIDVTVKAIFERLYLFQDWAHLGPESTVRMHLQPRLLTQQLFLDLCANFSLEWPLIFFVSTIHQVIWPSPGTLATGCLDCVCHPSNAFAEPEEIQV